jgi:hypothetical protein
MLPRRSPSVERGPAKRGEPDDWFPGVGELEAYPEPSWREESPEIGRSAKKKAALAGRLFPTIASAYFFGFSAWI